MNRHDIYSCCIQRTTHALPFLKMASFLSNTTAGAAFRQTNQRIVGSTVIGPPATPVANFAVGPGGVSVLPNLPSAPAGAPPIARINPRSNVLLEKNPRISLAYSVKQTGENFVQGDLVALEGNTNSWAFPELWTVQKWMEKAHENISDEDSFKEYFVENRLVGAFATTMDNASDRAHYGTDTVTINAARFSTVRDYWTCACKAGDQLFIVATHKKPIMPYEEDEISAKRLCSRDVVTFYFVCAKNHKRAAEMAKNDFKNDTGNDPESTVCIRVGKAQNNMVSAASRRDSMIQKYNIHNVEECYDYVNDTASKTARMREMHLDHLFMPEFFDDKPIDAEASEEPEE